MADTRWTPAQAAAIADRGGALLLSAAAGSGKTAVLTERAVGLITDPDKPAEADRLLIVTFTNAAAAELRARISQRLADRVQQDPANTRLRRQRVLLQRASICTVDAWCMDLLRRHFAKLDIPADFSAGDAGTLQALRDAALAETMEQMVADPAFCDFADLYGRGRSDAAAGEAILQLYDFLQALPDPDQCLAVYLDAWRQPDGFARSGMAGQVLAQAAAECRALAGALQHAQALCQQDCIDAQAEAADKKKQAAAKEKAAAAAREKFAWFQDRLADARTQLTALADLAEAGAWDSVYALLAPYRDEQLPMPGFKGSNKRLSGAHKNEIRALADRAGELWQKLCGRINASAAQIEADRRTALPMLEALAAAQRDFAARYYAKKRDKKVLDFSDMEHLALQLLRTPANIRDEAGRLLPAEKALAAMQEPEGCRTALCEQLRAGLDAVMVDEYQDTNALQDAIYNCLAAPGGSNLFFVGDIKQSIYRFRQADPAIFLARQASYPALPGAAARPRGTYAPAKLALDANFRSAPAVVEGINFIFERILSPQLGGVEYGDGQRLVCGAPGAYAGRVEAAVIPADPLQGKSAAREEAAWIADRIFRLVKEEQAPVRDKTGTRPIRYEDCCILVSARANFPVYAAALAARGIPAHADAAEDLLDAPQIRPLIALLRVMDNPARSIELAAAMNSALFGFTDDDLLRLRAWRGRCSLYGALVSLVQSGEDTAFAQKCRAFYDSLTALRCLSRSMPVDRLLEEIFASTGYLAAVGAGPDGARRREEARRFAAWAAQAGANGLGALVYAIEATRQAGGLMDGAAGQTKPGCVSIMTIHRSKGLQFPAVFLADSARSFNMEDTRRPVLLHRQAGIGLSLRSAAGNYPTAQKAFIRRQIESETRSERMRLLYVALTRAQDMLFLALPVRNAANAADKAAAALRTGLVRWQLAEANTACEWLLTALLCHPDARCLRELTAEADAGEGLGRFVPDSSAPLTLYVWENPLPEPTDAARDAAALPEPDAALVARLQAGFAWQYPHSAEAAVPAKVSVTGLAHREDTVTLDRPGFLSAEGLTAAQKGTALHAFLEHADFAALAAALPGGPDALRQAIRTQRDAQLALRLTAPEEAAALEEDKLLAFLQGEAFRRICAARAVYKEYRFITAVPAQRLPGAPAAGGEVLVQGIADLVLVFDDHVEILDYKTDRYKDEAALRDAYAGQLALYAQAVGRRLAPLPVTYKGIWSFGLGRLVKV